MRQDKKAYLGVSAHDIKQKFQINDYSKFDPEAHDSYANVHRSMVVGMNGKRLRIRFPDGTSSRIKYLDKATEDLKCMSALLIAGLLSPGIFADKLQEEFPEQEEAANFLREWEQTINSEVSEDE